MTGMVLELFAGPGGWSTGLRQAGHVGFAAGIEHDRAACLTAVAAGHLRIQADVAAYPLLQLVRKVWGLIGSPPCQAWSLAGLQGGQLDRDQVHALIEDFAAGRTPPIRTWADPRSALTAEPMRYVYALRPRWVALEQVPAVLPLWQHMAALLRGLGYRTWCGILSAEEFGVPQTRKRAILIASLDGPVGPPAPTHQAYWAGRPAQVESDLFGDPLPLPVSMAQALGWGEDTTVVSNYSTDGDTENPGIRAATAPSATVTSKVDRNRVRMAPAGASAMVEPRPDTRWVETRPATTVCGDARLGAPGHRDREGGERQFGEQSVRVTVQEAGVLQSFPPDYPWQGTKTAQYRQVGDAVPPALAAAILLPLISGPAALLAS